MTDQLVVLSLGANLGDRARQLDDAVRAIDALEAVRVVRVSGLWQSPAWVPTGATPGPDYLNLTVVVRTARTPRNLMDALLALETAAGRRRDPSTLGHGDRPLDIDIIEWPGQASTDGVVLPHPRAHERDFVLAPWLAIDADAELSGRGRVDALLAELPRTAYAWDRAPARDERGTGTPGAEERSAADRSVSERPAR